MSLTQIVTRWTGPVRFMTTPFIRW
jgi:hypothetical protein